MGSLKCTSTEKKKEAEERFVDTAILRLKERSWAGREVIEALYGEYERENRLFSLLRARIIVDERLEQMDENQTDLRLIYLYQKLVKILKELDWLLLRGYRIDP